MSSEMNSNISSLGYEEVYQDRLDETRSMITLVTLIDVLDQGVSSDINYRSVMSMAYDVAEKANPNGIATQVPEISLVTSAICSNIKIMIYNLIEFSITSLVQAIYDCVKSDNCGYADVSKELQNIWLHSRLKVLNDPNANNSTAEKTSKKLLDDAVSGMALELNPRNTISGGNLDGLKILNLFKSHGVTVHPGQSDYREKELEDIKNGRNGLAHGSVSFAEAGNQVTSSELVALINHVDSFLTQLHDDVLMYLSSKGYKNTHCVSNAN